MLTCRSKCSRPECVQNKKMEKSNATVAKQSSNYQKSAGVILPYTKPVGQSSTSPLIPLSAAFQSCRSLKARSTSLLRIHEMTINQTDGHNNLPKSPSPIPLWLICSRSQLMGYDRPARVAMNTSRSRHLSSGKKPRRKDVDDLQERLDNGSHAINKLSSLRTFISN